MLMIQQAKRVAYFITVDHAIRKPEEEVSGDYVQIRPIILHHSFSNLRNHILIARKINLPRIKIKYLW